MDLKEEVPGSRRVPNIGAVDDTSEAQWLVEELDASLGTVNAVMPRGFEAYARILHPAWRVRREGGRLVRTPVRWSEVAELRGTTAHRLMQWPQVWALPQFDDSAIEYCVDAGLAPIEGPDEGRLPPQVARVIHQVLSAHTDTPAPCWFGVWVGFAYEYRKEIPATRSLSTQYREWDLFRAPLDALTLNFFDVGDFFYQSANIAWPDDRSWCLATDIDMKSSYLGGTKALIEAVLRHEALEAYEASTDDPLCVDDVNPQVDLSNFSLGLIGGDNENWQVPLRERMLGAIFGFAMRLGGRGTGFVGFSKRKK